MKKFVFCLTLLTLLASLFACGRRQDILNQIESEKAAESIAKESSVIDLEIRPRETLPTTSETIPPIPGETETLTSPIPGETDVSTPPTVGTYPNDEGYRLTGGMKQGDTGYYEGITIDDLKERYDPNGMQASHFQYNTPTGIIYTHPDGSCTYYNKLTGNVTALCPDPLCRHEDDCVWRKLRDIVYISEDHIYFTSGSLTAPMLFRSDLERNHVENLGLNLWGQRVVYAQGDRLYIEKQEYQENEAGSQSYGIFDCQTKEFTKLSGDMDIYILAVTGNTVWYQDGATSIDKIYKADIDLGNAERVLEDFGALYISQSNQNYLIVTKADTSEKLLYEIATKKVTPLPEIKKGTATSPAFDDKYIYYTKPISAEESVNSPLHEYYQYTKPDYQFPDLIYGGYGRDAGRLYRMNLQTLEEELVMEVSYNGVPLAILDYVVDGDAIFIQYLTYEDHNNYYNPDYGKEEGFIRKQAPARYLYVDIANGTVNLLDPYNIG